ncbi:Lrp/AsnC family transcriptional regulator [Paenarthrobacter sp. NPDC089322]|uniref:Lrp/AsnC family transcriptional regulator n=1 Tax=Paenarthrobacter sp. NPDC089322 TaxID=3155065 RepID=UPI003447D08F
MSAWAMPNPSTDSSTTARGSLMSFFMGCSWACCVWCSDPTTGGPAQGRPWRLLHVMDPVSHPDVEVSFLPGPFGQGRRYGPARLFGKGPMERAGLDAIDQSILAELTRNARVPHAVLASKVMLSRNAVRQRIERMERQGYIQGYTVVSGGADPDSVSAFFMVYRKDRMRGADVLSALRSIPEVVLCDVLSGDFDLIVRVEARTLGRVQEIWEEIAAIPGVADTVTAMTLSNVIRRSSA